MTRNPQSIRPDEFAAAALEVMERRKITSLPVVDSQGMLLGVLHLHDLWGTQLV
jgi:arabinose-5-phosphate isomerase